MNLSNTKSTTADRARKDIILARLRSQGETSHAKLREQAVQDYLDKHIIGDTDHMDNARWGIVDQMWVLHAEAKIFRDIHKGTWILC
jgi:hypothetical protein